MLESKDLLFATVEITKALINANPEKYKKIDDVKILNKTMNSIMESLTYNFKDYIK